MSQAFRFGVNASSSPGGTTLSYNIASLTSAELVDSVTCDNVKVALLTSGLAAIVYADDSASEVHVATVAIDGSWNLSLVESLQAH